MVSVDVKHHVYLLEQVWQHPLQRTDRYVYDMVHGCMVYTERAETAAVSRGTSHVSTKQRRKYTTSVHIQK